MTATIDAAVSGGGVIGLAAALTIAERLRSGEASDHPAGGTPSGQPRPPPRRRLSAADA